MKHLAILFIYLYASARELPAQHKTNANTGVEGSWAYKGIGRYMDCRGPVMEEIFSPLDNKDLFIQNDTLWILNYPCRFYERWPYTLKDSAIYMTGNHFFFAQATIKNDELTLSLGNCIYQVFTRNTFEAGTLNILAHDTTNAACLLGKTKIVTHFAPNDEAAFDVIPPVPMPKQIVINQQAKAQAMVKHKSITLTIQGQKRLFALNRMEWFKALEYTPGSDSYTRKSSYFFVLTPAGNWWKGDPFEVRYAAE